MQMQKAVYFSNVTYIKCKLKENIQENLKAFYKEQIQNFKREKEQRYNK